MRYIAQYRIHAMGSMRIVKPILNYIFSRNVIRAHPYPVCLTESIISRVQARRMKRKACFLLSKGRAAMGKGSSNDPEFGVIRLERCLDVN